MFLKLKQNELKSNVNKYKQYKMQREKEIKWEEYFKNLIQHYYKLIMNCDEMYKLPHIISDNKHEDQMNLLRHIKFFLAVFCAA